MEGRGSDISVHRCCRNGMFILYLTDTISYIFAAYRGVKCAM